MLIIVIDERCGEISTRSDDESTLVGIAFFFFFNKLAVYCHFASIAIFQFRIILLLEMCSATVV